MSPNSKNNFWSHARVIPGKRIAATLGFPTINLDNVAILSGKKEGVYAVLVKFEDKIHPGVLYYGPRLILGEKEKIAEIFILNYMGDLYGKTVYFHLKEFIRPPKNFPDFAEFKQQLISDCSRARQILLK